MRASIGLILLGLFALGCPPLEGGRGQTSADGQRTVSLVKVVDGDTLIVRDAGQQLRLRLSGIDAPELAQPYGAASRRALAGYLAGLRRLQYRRVDRDRYGRIVAEVWRDGASVTEWMVAQGHAWHYRRYNKGRRVTFDRLESQARTARRGLWQQARPDPPWRYRRGRRAQGPAAGPAALRSEFVGNSRSRVFHHRRCAAARCAHCRVPFASSAAAVQAGYRPHRVCQR
ncbi:MAG: thermonuclease family protein [Deltaproteobacteria bacterium]|nr:thermonuclease family protein [Deltaproteobacteria bacterium]